MSPFRTPNLSFLKSGVAKLLREAPQATPEVKGWQVLTKPINASQLLAAIVGTFTDGRALGSLPARSLSMGHSLRHTPLGALARHPKIKELPIRVMVVDDMPVKQNLIRWIVETHGMPLRPTALEEVTDGRTRGDLVVLRRRRRLGRRRQQPHRSG